MKIVPKAGDEGPKDIEAHVAEAFLAAFGTEKRESTLVAEVLREDRTRQISRSANDRADSGQAADYERFLP
jgi:hypothetical protein